MKNLILMVFAVASLNAVAQNIGIGTNNPLFRLDVQGRIRVKTGTLGNVTTSSGIWMDDFRDGNNRIFIGMQDSTQFGFFSSTLGWDFRYDAKTGNTGLGISSSTNKLSVNGRIGIFSSGLFVGSLSANNDDFLISAKTGNLLTLTSPGNIIMQQTSSPGFTAGKVGIGTETPDTKLQVEGGTDVSVTGGGYLQLGASAATNIGVDDNEIQARNNGAAAKLFIQPGGADLQIGGTNHIIINDGYQVYRNRPLSTNADLLPIAYAKVNQLGVVLSGTGNLSVTRVSQGQYRIVLLGENNIFTNSDLYSMLVTVSGKTVALPKYTSTYIGNDNAIWVNIANPKIDYTNTTVNGTAVSYVATNVYPDPADADFCIFIYKM